MTAELSARRRGAAPGGCGGPVNVAPARRRRRQPSLMWQGPAQAGRIGRHRQGESSAPSPRARTTGASTVDDEHQEPASTEPGTPPLPPSLGGHDPSVPPPGPTASPVPGWVPPAPVGGGVPPYGGPPPPAWPPGTILPSPAAPTGRSSPRWLVVAVVAALVGGAVGAGIAEAVGTGGTPVGTTAIRVGSASPGPALAGNASIPTHREADPPRGGVDRRQRSGLEQRGGPFRPRTRRHRRRIRGRG